MTTKKPEVPNPLDNPQDNKGVEVPAVQPAKGLHETPAFVAEARQRAFTLPDGVTLREDR